ncbi:WD40/YVTN/BNR-like repeat-containing protein [Caldimonas sp. KR1-144]|uniref:WD40/YVTN/BNR-like repeat-containing protein n=1 Tax=Caldimonas sp. KR1-144 TaxID=3400911 RepID=UPI003C09BBCB
MPFMHNMPILRSTPSWAATLLVALLAACGGGDGGSRESNAGTGDTFKALIAVNAEAAGSTQCPSGGSRIDAGLDLDRNGSLSPNEVGSTQFVCHGSPGATGTAGHDGLGSLVQMQDEPAGSHCATGGKAIQVGVDANANGVLDASEIGSTGYVCNGASGANGADGSNGTNGSDGANGLSTLMSIVDEAAGANCGYGGRKISSGLDRDADGQLDADEVDSTSYVCHGAPADALNWVDVTGTAVQAEPNTGYVARNDTQQVLIALPANPAIGDVVRITGAGLGGWKLVQSDAQGANAAQSVYTKNLGGMAGVVWTARETNRPWRSVASSADGSKLVAVADDGAISSGDQIYTSTDGGLSWTPRAPVLSWHSVASSADGSKLVAVAAGGELYTSADSGVNWTMRQSGLDGDVASSADGSKLVVAADQIYTSTDSGVNWTPREPSRSWSAVASSADGNRLVALVGAGQIYTSVDSGESWTARESNRFWVAVASSADGSRLLAAASGGQLYTSSDGGLNWTARDADRMWSAVASSADGSKLAAVVAGGQIYTSSDGGETWTAHEWNRWWRSVASSADASKLVAVDYHGQIYTSVATTLPGAAGSISGGPSDAIELQYIGNGMFNVLSHEGAPSFR